MRKFLVNQLMEQLGIGLSRKEAASEPLLTAFRPGQAMPVRPRLMLQTLGVAAGLTISAWGYAVGLGGINVVSALGQPLKAEIELVAVNKADKPGLVARLASPDTYKGAGLDYPFGVKYTFQIESHANGQPYLKLTSNQEINDPFVSLLVELSWSSGKLMREYTFLLDPPGYVADQPKSAPVQTMAPVVVQSMPPDQVKPQAVPVTRAAMPVKEPVAEKRVTRPEQAVKSEQVATGAVTVRSGDTLNKIAARTKPDQVSLERMLVALYRANEDQFDGNNMNRIRTGKVLHMPDKNALTRIDQAEAMQEIRAQADDWNAYRQKLAGAATTSRQSDASHQAVSGKVTSAAVDKTPVARESAKEVLRLSKGEAPGDKTGGTGKSLQDKKNAAAEEAIAKAKAVGEEKTRAALLENNLKDMKRLAQLKTEAAALSAAAASKVAAASAVASAAPAVNKAVSAVVAASSVAAASQVRVASAVKPTVTEAPSLMDSLMDSPLLMGVGAAALVALGGLGIVMGRRKRASAQTGKPAEEDVGTITGHLTNPVTPSPDTGDFTAVHLPVEEVTMHPDDVDPISEAELFLNFGRDEQAEEVLKDALRRTPDNHQIHLKLLGIYANRQDAESFAVIEQLLQDAGDVEAIDQAAILARKLHPAAKSEDAAREDDDSATQFSAAFNTLDAPPLDLHIDEVQPEAEAIDFDVTTTQPASPVDFDVTATTPMMAASETLDFDLAAAEPEFAEPLETSLPALDDLIFDVTKPAAPKADEALSFERAAEEDNAEFMLDFPLDDSAKPAAPPAPAINLADISLEMDDIPAPQLESVDAVKSEQWHEVATKLDLAKAYQEMGDEVGAREILDEVLVEGDAEQQQVAQLLIKQMG